MGTASLAPGTATLRGSGYQATATNFEDTTVRAGSGTDSGMAVLYDSAGDDTLVATPGFTVLSGAGFSSRVEGFASVLASGTGGGTDTARFFDSPGNDTFLGTPTYSRLRGDGFYLRAKGFESVHVQATAGGSDRAYLFDSSGNDTLQVSRDAVSLTGAGFSIRIDTFEYVTARAGRGSDTAIFQTPASGAQFRTAADYALLTGQDFSVRADSFDRVHAQAVMATAAVSQDAYPASIKPDLAPAPSQKPLDHVLTQSSAAELYGFELARHESDDDGDESETQALDQVLEQLEDWT